MKKRTIVGGYAFTWWFVTDVQRLSLEVMTLNPVCESVETAQGVPLTVTGVAQCKIMKADELLHTASEQFLGKSVYEIKSTILSTLEGHLRAILGISLERILKEKEKMNIFELWKYETLYITIIIMYNELKGVLNKKNEYFLTLDSYTYQWQMSNSNILQRNNLLFCSWITKISKLQFPKIL